MPSRIHPRTWEKYDKLRGQGMGQTEAARASKVSRTSAVTRENRIKQEKGFYGPGEGKIAMVSPQGKVAAPVPMLAARGPIPPDRLCDEARRALDDFALFRRRYFGRKSTPWQEDAAHRIADFLVTKRKEFVVINCPPGSGKSTLFTHDIPVWLTCRDRGIRAMIGSASQKMAESYLRRLKQTFESPLLMKAESRDLEMGLGYDAEAVLLVEYGIFKPENALWAAHSLIVAQADDRPLTQKEPTWSAFGAESAYLGGRFDFVIWDDVTDDSALVTEDRIEKERSRWDKVAETRLEPAGLLVLQGQRLAPEDIYRHNLDKKAGSSDSRAHEECCDAEDGRMYHHIRYRAHYEDRCTGEHDEVAYYPDGCLLDPNRLPWHELETKMENNSSNFMQVYQQEDVDPAQTLVNSLWLVGGTDPATKEVFPGCYDRERGLWELPQLSMPYVSYLCVDPSPTKMWGITLWVYHPASELRFLIDVMNVKMPLSQFFDWSDPKGGYVGVLQDWYQRTVVAGYPLTTLIFEANAAQRFFLSLDSIRRWQQMTGVRVIGHETYAKNKLDPELGPQRLAALYRRGLVRLPYRDEKARFATMKLVDEVTKYPKHRKDDLVMSQWFGEANLAHVYAKTPPLRFVHRPTWMKDPVPA